MNPHDHDPGPLDEREATALAALDDRGRAAGAALRAAVAATLVAEPPAEPGAQSGHAPTVRPLPAADPLMYAAAGAAPRRRRSWVLVAAAALAVAAAAASAVVLADEEPPGVSSGGTPQLLPGWLPDGFVTDIAIDYGQIPVSDGQVVVYGRASDPDPWSGPLLAVSETHEQWELSEVPGEVEVVVGDRRGFQLTSGGVVSVRVEGDDDMVVVVVGHGLPAEDVVTAAASATGDPSDPALAAEAMPADFTEIARGPQTATVGLRLRHRLVSAYPGSLGISYMDTATGGHLGLLQRPGTAADVDLVRVGHPDSRPVTVRGEQGVLSVVPPIEPGQPPELVLQWWDPSGMLITLAGVRMSEDDLLRIATDMRPATDGEVEALLAEHGGEVEESLAAGSAGEVASGTELGVDWSLSVAEAPDQVSLELTWGVGGAGTLWDPSTGPGDLLVSRSQAADWPGTALFGIVAADVASVTVEGPGLPATEVDLHGAMVGEAPMRVFAFFPPPGAGEVTVVARDLAGAEVARDQ